MGERMQTASLFDYLDQKPNPPISTGLNYPFHASFRARGTSEDAAIKIESCGNAENLRNRALFVLKIPHTAKEAAAILGEDINNLRPRLTELKARMLIEETGERRLGQNVYVAVT